MLFRLFPSIEQLAPVAKLSSFCELLLRTLPRTRQNQSMPPLNWHVKDAFVYGCLCRYRSVNTESAAYKSKLQPLVGPSIIFKALGFEKTDDNKWKLDGYVNQFIVSFFVAVG
jgi:hypothetical protein